MALSASRNTPEWGNAGRRFHYGNIPVEASTSLYVGGMVCRDASGNAVKAQAIGASPLDRLMVLGIVEGVYAGGDLPPGVDALNQTGNAALYPGATATLGTAGAIYVKVCAGIFGMDYDATITTARVGLLVFASDDHTVTLGTATANTTALAIAANTQASGAAVLPLNKTNIVPGTFAVTAGSAGTGTLYAEGTDYELDYEAGLFTITTGGALNNLSASVYVSFYSSATLPVAGRLVAIDGGQAYVNFEDKNMAM